MKKFCVVLLLQCIVFSACKHNTLPPEIWGKEQMIEFLTQAQLVEAKVTTQKLPKKQSDSLYARYYKELFAYYDTDQETWQKNIEYYRDKPDEMDSIYKEVISRLTLMESTL